MSAIPQQDILRVLERHLSPPNARAVLGRATRQFGDPLSADSLPEVVASMERGLRMFAGPSVTQELTQKLLALAPRSVRPVKVDVLHERDVVTARLAARDLCQAMGSRPLATQRVATAVSELARNICLYTQGGTVTMTPLGQPYDSVEIVAADEGPGVRDLEAVLSGEYVSKTGMGKGIAGVKRMSDRFEITTGPRGTRVEVVMVLQGGGST